MIRKPLRTCLGWTPVPLALFIAAADTLRRLTGKLPAPQAR